MLACVKITMLVWIAVQGPASNQSVDKDYVMADKSIVCAREDSKSKASGIEKRVKSRLKNKFAAWLVHCEKFHSGKYDYSQVVYTGIKNHVEIICPTHGVFTQSPDAHSRQGCRLCGNLVRNQKTNAPRIKEARKRFFQESPIVHGGKYDYSKVVYVNCKTKVEIICPVHGSIFQAPLDHISGKGCNKCAGNNSDYSRQQFVIEAAEMHSGKYDYSKAVYAGCYDKVEIICPKHGSFWQAAIAHKRGQGCPTCNESRGEREVARWLRNNHIPFERQKRFESCKNKRSLPFDFYIPLFTLIEYDGPHHHDKEFSDRMGYDWEYRQKNDAIKTRWCEDNGYQLIRISEIDDIPSLGGALFQA